MLAQEIDGKENAIYYLSKKFIKYEVRYTPLEKLCLALVWRPRQSWHGVHRNLRNGQLLVALKEE